MGEHPLARPCLHLISGKYRYEIMAATILGQGKNVWQAEIDAAADVCFFPSRTPASSQMPTYHAYECGVSTHPLMFHAFTESLLQLSDFFRFGVKSVEELYAQQSQENAQCTWNRLEYRPLEGFVLAVSPFNFTAIGGSLAGAYPSRGWFTPYRNPVRSRCTGPCRYDRTGTSRIAGIHFMGRRKVFRNVWKEIGDNVDQGAYKSYPRVVGETGGKNRHLVHQSADVKNAVFQSVRSVFEYQGQFISSSLPCLMLGAQMWIGQKCSALSRVYVASSVWPQFKQMLLEETAKIKVGPSERWENSMGPVM